ncbi:hypothetical protein SDA97_02720 [Legionella pneumophila serogroup 1]
MISLKEAESKCSTVKLCHCYSTKYGERFIKSITNELYPPITFKGLPYLQRFYAEICPIVKVAIIESCSHFLYFGDNFPFDGMLIDKITNKILNVECTQAIDGQLNALANEHSIKYGEAPAYDIPKTNNTKASGVREIYLTDSKGYTQSDLIQKLSNLILRSLEKKLDTDYPFKKGILIIIFDNTYEHLKDLKQVFGSIFQSKINEIKKSSFNKIYFISKGFFICSHSTQDI